MGVCKRAIKFDTTPFYMWIGWDFINMIGLFIAIGLFYYAYIHVCVLLILYILLIVINKIFKKLSESIKNKKSLTFLFYRNPNSNNDLI